MTIASLLDLQLKQNPLLQRDFVQLYVFLSKTCLRGAIRVPNSKGQVLDLGYGTGQERKDADEEPKEN